MWNHVILSNVKLMVVRYVKPLSNISLIISTQDIRIMIATNSKTLHLFQLLMVALAALAHPKKSSPNLNGRI